MPTLYSVHTVKIDLTNKRKSIMNLSEAITIALKELRDNGQKITDSHKIFIHAIDGKLKVTALKKDGDESIAVSL